MGIRVICEFTGIFISIRVGHSHTCLILVQPGPLGATARHLIRIHDRVGEASSLEGIETSPISGR